MANKNSYQFRLIILICTVQAILLTVTALFYLRHALPDQYLAERWKAVWIGLDLGMAALTIATLVLLLKDSYMAVITATAIATLLLADAWFDCMTAGSGDLRQSLFALVGEIPAAGFFFQVAVTVARRHRSVGSVVKR